MRILKTTGSLHSARGQSSRLAERFIYRLRDIHPAREVVTRDLARQPIRVLQLAAGVQQ